MTVLVLGPSLGTSAQTLWGACVPLLTPRFEVLAWDLPGHGTNRDQAAADLTIADLAADVLSRIDSETFHYAGDSVGGAVGLQLLLDAPQRVLSATVLCSAAQFGEPEHWHDRIAQVRASGTAGLVESSALRWFSPGFLSREPARGSALLHALHDADDAVYAAVCHALAGFDVRDRLAEIAAPVLAVAGAEDQATPPAQLRAIADGVQTGRLVVLDGVGHLAPAEAPDEVARLIIEHCLGPMGEGVR